jgi:DNA-binding NtrC family response regulator
MNSPLRVLHLEDDIRDTELVRATLESEWLPTDLTRVEAEQEFVSALKGGSFDLILADYTLPAFDGLSALKLAQEHAPDVTYIFFFELGRRCRDRSAVERGATDCVLKTRLAGSAPSVYARCVKPQESRAQAGRGSAARQRRAMEGCVREQSGHVLHGRQDGHYRLRKCIRRRPVGLQTERIGRPVDTKCFLRGRPKTGPEAR